MKAQAIVDYVFGIAPNAPWSKENIFEFGDGTYEVTAVGLAWWLTSDMLKEFPANGITLGLSHERVIYDLNPDFPWGKVYATERLPVNRWFAAFTAEHRIAIHRFHSNLDLAEWGMGRALVCELGWDSFAADWSRGIPVVEHPPVTLRELIGEVKTKLRLPFVRYDGDLDRIVRRIGVPWGGICQWWTGAASALPLGYDCILGGDVIDGVVRFAREHNLCVIDAMHHATELQGMRNLAEKLRQRFPQLEVYYYENSMPWAVVV